MGSLAEVLRMSNRMNTFEEEELHEKTAPIELFPVLFKRAVCIHSSLQFVDLFMQNVMFSHGFSTSPVIPKREDDDEEVISKTLIAFEKIRNEFREIFRSRHRNSVTEVAVFIGTCPVRSIYSYRVPINLCEAIDSTHDNCGDTCAELNDVERRKINRDLFMLSQTRNTPEYEKHLNNQNHRLFVFVKGSDEMIGDEIEEEDPPFGCKPCRQYTFSHENCNCEGLPNARSDGKWLRMVPFIVHTRH